MCRVLGLLALLWATLPAHGTSCIGPITVCSSFDQSTVVFRGRVVAIDSTSPPPIPVTHPDGSETVVYSGPGTDRVLLDVLETFKGHPGKQISISAGQGMFKEGGEYVVFASTNTATNEIVASVCARTHALTDPEHDADLAWLRAYPNAPPTATIYGKFEIIGSADEKVVGSVAISGKESRAVAADDKSSYAFKDLAPGTYTVAARIPNGMLTDGPQTVTIAAKGCAEVDWYLKYDSHIKGAVTDSTGKPVSAVFVSVLQPEDNRVGFTRTGFGQTDEHGSYDISKIPPGDYWVALHQYAPSRTEPYLPVFYPSGSTPATAQLVHLPASGTLEELNLVLPPPLQPAVVHVRVVHQDGTPVDQARLIAKDMNANLGLTFFDATTNADGWADITLYAGQEYFLFAETPGEREPPCGGPLKFVAKEGLAFNALTLDKTMSECRQGEPK